VNVLGAEPALGAALLERLPPAPDFANVGPESDEAAARAVARCIREKWRGDLEDQARFPSIENWAEDFDRVWATAEPITPLGYTTADIATAQNDFAELLHHSGETCVLHGDLHHGNLLRDSSGRPVAIDPKGVTGPLAFEVGAFMRNPAPALTGWPNPVATLHRRADLFAEELEIAPALTLRWSVVQLALSAVRAAADGDQVWSRCAANLKPLMTAAAAA
jgi:streptomycin 6-kinase